MSARRRLVDPLHPILLVESVIRVVQNLSIALTEGVSVRSDLLVLLAFHKRDLHQLHLGDIDQTLVDP
jgi:hypothetical protein